LLEVDSPSDVVENASIKAQNMSEMSGNIARYSQHCVFNSGTARAAEDSY
jgi:hypothetical protein